MPERLYFTDADEANALIASDPMALLVGFELDQRVTVMKAFQGPLALKERRPNLRIVGVQAARQAAQHLLVENRQRRARGPGEDDEAD